MAIPPADLPQSSDDDPQDSANRTVADVASTAANPDLALVDERDWGEARRRLRLIEPLLGVVCPRSIVTAQAQSGGVVATTIYRWAQKYRASGGLLSSLLPVHPSGGRGQSRLEPDVEKLLMQTVEDHYLTKQQLTIRSTAMEVVRRCREAHLPPPNIDTVRVRIRALPMQQRLAKRAHRKEAMDRFAARPGTFDDAKKPLDFMQIDHTKLDIIVVDEKERLPVGRPWITLAIDVYSRMVLGFAISLDPPGAISTGLCISHAVLPKQAWLEQRGVAGQWPCWGFPRHIHLDNAKEFHGEMLRRACEQYGIHLEYRPVAQPHMGGHIERLLGTLMRALHELPGATFSNPRQRGKYDSDATATMTLRELEHWFTEYVVSVYHMKLHRGIGMTPLERWSAALSANSEGRNNSDILSLPSAQERIRLDFLPFVERMIQPIGVVIDGIQYFHDVFRSLVGSIDGGRRRKFLFRRDPRDISTIFFWHPDMQQYTSIPYRNTSHPAISVWELRELRRKLQESGNAQITEQAIFMAYERLREREACATQTTKRIRRERERRPQPRHSPTAHNVIAPEPSSTVITFGEIIPFEIEETS